MALRAPALWSIADREPKPPTSVLPSLVTLGAAKRAALFFKMIKGSNEKQPGPRLDGPNRSHAVEGPATRDPQ